MINSNSMTFSMFSEHKKHIYAFFLMTFCSVSTGSEVNLALHKKYVILPKPDYKLCTDAADMVQLTDGKAFGSPVAKKSTVGWNLTTTAPEIILDLGKIESIEKVRIHCIGGGHGGVGFPRFVAVFVSDDGKNYTYGGSSVIIDSNRSVIRKEPRMFSVKGMETLGRFVKVVLQPSDRHLFLDEIEIIRGDQKSNTTVNNELYFPKGRDIDEVLRAIESRMQIYEKIFTTIEVAKNNKTLLGKDFADKTINKLNTLAQEILSEDSSAFLFKELPLLNNHVDISRADIYRKIYNKPYICIAANPTEILLERNMHIVPNNRDEQINIQLWQYEYEMVAINVINCSRGILRLFANILSLNGPDGVILENEKTFTTRRAVYVDGREVGSIADAFVLQKENEFSVAPGQTTQLVITVFNPTLKPGMYKTTIVVKAKQQNMEGIPLQKMQVNMEVFPIKLDIDVALNCCVWAYPQIKFRADINKMSESILDLQQHYTNTIVAHGSYSVPFPRKQHIGKRVTSKVDYSRLDRLIKMTGYARRYLLFLDFNKEKNQEFFGKWMTPNWRKNFSLWLVQLVDYLKENNIGYDKFALYPFDERLHDKLYELARFIKKVDPNICIFANSLGKGPSDFMRIKELIDIWCPLMQDCISHPDWLAKIKGFGKTVWTYKCKGPGKANRPYDYYRLMPWRAFKNGLTGAGFWVYVSNDFDKSWNHTGYTVIYDAEQSPVNTYGENIIPSRRWQVWRDGIEDYQYLYELQKTINSIRDRNPLRAKKAQQILDTQVDDVLKRPKDCEVVYRARQTITTTLMDLNLPESMMPR